MNIVSFFCKVNKKKRFLLQLGSLVSTQGSKERASRSALLTYAKASMFSSPESLVTSSFKVHELFASKLIIILFIMVFLGVHANALKTPYNYLRLEFIPGSHHPPHGHQNNSLSSYCHLYSACHQFGWQHIDLFWKAFCNTLCLFHQERSLDRNVGLEGS